MDAKQLYKRLDEDFELDSLTDDWNDIQQNDYTEKDDQNKAARVN